jgi:hypothetical protein
MLSKTTHEARFGKSQRTFCGVTQAFTIENWQETKQQSQNWTLRDTWNGNAHL